MFPARFFGAYIDRSGTATLQSAPDGAWCHLHLACNLFQYSPVGHYTVETIANIRVFAKKNIQPIIPSNLKKAKFIRASL